ncbi:hypothetical protein GCM10022251_53800 [Phytohabitans flavus]|uniref:Peptidase S33 tripeptidyl aminopeptidase-like C-terminal domain-containing protein n=1 Tax=Phytohabitans flavus TaxID=1076124 RepID=A0A6F8XM08_9ACTN|nr:alpha/beta hydrolase [Phytohabitans flavus]BCB74845.1 hypothetical protein Pflav_012550 [Phytohabitans flavus]
MRRTLSIALAVAVAAGTTAPVQRVSETETLRTSSTLRWGPCPADVTSPDLECTMVQVPLDYRNPQGRTIDIAVSRLPSKNPAQRRGVLLTNPGGHGAYGLLAMNTCANDTVTTFLTTGQRPHRDIACAAEPG